MLTAMPDAVLPLLDVTGAFSRDALDARLAAERHALRESGAPCALLVLEVDDLDAYGAGPRAEILHGVAHRLRERHRCWPYRVSDDAFVVPLPHGDETAGGQLAEIVRASVAIRPVAGVAITVSVGVAAGIGWDDNTLALRADAALRRAQDIGGNAAVADGAGLVTPADERPPRPRRIAAPRSAVTHDRESWWSLLTRREDEAQAEPAPAPTAVAPDPTQVAPAHAVADRLTGALTTDALSWEAAELASRVEQNGTPVALVVADIDHFTHINDTFGRGAGDDVLREVARRVRATGGMAYRVGGDTFAVVLTGEDTRRAFAVAERIRGSIAAASAGRLELSASVGVATARPGAGFELAAVQARAIAAAHAAPRGEVRIDAPAAATQAAPGQARTLRAA
jgi:diguanylate cyclase (GGDEF)-like protein